MRAGDLARVPCELVAQGPGPQERSVRVRTSAGWWQELIVSGEQSSVCVRVVESGPSDSLIELPSEAASGAWRIWVPTDSVISTSRR